MITAGRNHEFRFQAALGAAVDHIDTGIEVPVNDLFISRDAIAPLLRVTPQNEIGTRGKYSETLDPRRAISARETHTHGSALHPKNGFRRHERGPKIRPFHHESNLRVGLPLVLDKEQWHGSVAWVAGGRGPHRQQ